MTISSREKLVDGNTHVMLHSLIPRPEVHPLLELSSFNSNLLEGNGEPIWEIINCLKRGIRTSIYVKMNGEKSTYATL
jgi:hypothetical protein